MYCEFHSEYHTRGDWAVQVIVNGQPSADWLLVDVITVTPTLTATVTKTDTATATSIQRVLELLPQWSPANTMYGGVALGAALLQEDT